MIVLLLLFNTIFSIQAQEIVRIHRDPQTGEIWTPPPLEQKMKPSRLSLSYQLELSENSYRLNTFEGSYAHQWNNLWPEIFTSVTVGPRNALSAGADPSDQLVGLSGFGLGLSNQSRITQKLLKMPNSFENVTLGAGYYILQREDHGLGIKADFKVFIYSASNLHYGFKLTYHLVHLIDASPVQFFSWLNVGFDVAFYF